MRKAHQFSLANEFFHVGYKLLDVVISYRPGAHNAVNIGFDKFVKMPAPRVKIALNFRRQTDENRVSLHRKDGIDFYVGAETLLVKSPSQGAARKRILETSWPACLMR
jgi:hypothetical protein